LGRKNADFKPFLADINVKRQSSKNLLVQSRHSIISCETLKKRRAEFCFARKTLTEYLLGKDTNYINPLQEQIWKALNNFDSVALADSFTKILLWNTHFELRATEGQYHSLIFSVLKAMGFSVASQQNTAEGYFDILLTIGKKVAFIFEFKHESFKVNPEHTEEEEANLKKDLLTKGIQKAKKQIEKRHYDRKYFDEYEVVKRVAVAFTAKTEVAAEIY
jgi:hypothetical protein